MSNSSLIETKVQGSLDFARDSLRSQSPTEIVSSIQRLLDVISSIIAEEYITIAKLNPQVFLKQGANK